MKDRTAAYLFWAYCFVTYVYGYVTLNNGDSLFGKFYADTPALKLSLWAFSPFWFILFLIDWTFHAIAEMLF